MARNRKTPVARLLAAVGNVVVVAFVLSAIVAALRVPRTESDLGQYERLLADWSSKGLTAHFPPTVPAGVLQARLSSFPGYLQGGGHLQLYMLVSPEDAAAADDKYASLATHTFHGGNGNVHMNLPDGVPTTYFRTSGTKDTDFDSSFNIYVLSVEAASHGGGWNHGRCCGVAVSTKHNEVVYWAESW